MATSLLEHETVNVSLEDVVRARPTAASPVTQSRSTTADSGVPDRLCHSDDDRLCRDPSRLPAALASPGSRI